MLNGPGSPVFPVIVNVTLLTWLCHPSRLYCLKKGSQLGGGRGLMELNPSSVGLPRLSVLCSASYISWNGEHCFSLPYLESTLSELPFSLVHYYKKGGWTWMEHYLIWAPRWPGLLQSHWEGWYGSLPPQDTSLGPFRTPLICDAKQQPTTKIAN